MGDDIFPAENYSNSTRKSLLRGVKLKLFKYLSIPAILLLASTSVQATIFYGEFTTEKGPFQSWYDSSWYLEGPDDATGGTITWTDDELVDTKTGCSIFCYLAVKYGAVGDPNQYIFDKSKWDGIVGRHKGHHTKRMDIVLNGSWVDPYRGAKSHVATYGVVPLPAAFWLFGTALIGFVGVSRRRSV